MKHHILAHALLVCAVFLLSISCVWSAHAQSIPAMSANLSGTVTATGQFQVIQGQSNGRRGCLIQNDGSQTMYVYFGTLANAMTGNSAQLTPPPVVKSPFHPVGYVHEPAPDIVLLTM